MKRGTMGDKCDVKEKTRNDNCMIAFLRKIRIKICAMQNLLGNRIFCERCSCILTLLLSANESLI